MCCGGPVAPVASIQQPGAPTHSCEKQKHLQTQPGVPSAAGPLSTAVLVEGQLSFCDEIAPVRVQASCRGCPAGAVPAEPCGVLGRAAGAPLTVCHAPSLMTGPLLVTRPTPW